MKKYLLLIAVLFFAITTNAKALTIDGNYVYTKGGTKITLEDYKLVRRFFKFKDEMFDFLDEGIEEHYVKLAKSRIYSGDYLFKVTFHSKDSKSWSDVSTEEGIRMLKENIQEELPYLICLPEIHLQPITVEYDFDEKDSDIYTHEKADYYDKYCGLDVILKAVENNINQEENIEEDIKNEKINMAVISVIPTSIVIILFFIIKKWKKLKEVN